MVFGFCIRKFECLVYQEVIIMKKQAGFTLIELIAVIVVLGILSAVALPKFVNLSGEARIAKMQGAVGAVNSAGALIHAKWLAGGSLAAGNVVYEGGTLAIATDMVNGYPAAGKIDLVSGLNTAASGDFAKSAVASGTITFSDPNKSACSFTYTEAGVNGVPTVNTAGLTPTNCQ
jgi:MSHA pilin protein MshA